MALDKLPEVLETRIISAALEKMQKDCYRKWRDTADDMEKREEWHAYARAVKQLEKDILMCYKLLMKQRG